MLQGLACIDANTAEAITRAAFDMGLVVETAGADGDVVKLLPPLVIEDDELDAGLVLLERAVDKVTDDASARLLEEGVLS